MILAGQLNLKVVCALAWVIFGGWILAIEFIELSRIKKKIPGYRHTTKGHRRTDYLTIALGIWIFGITIFLLV